MTLKYFDRNSVKWPLLFLLLLTATMPSKMFSQFLSHFKSEIKTLLWTSQLNNSLPFWVHIMCKSSDMISSLYTQIIISLQRLCMPAYSVVHISLNVHIRVSKLPSKYRYCMPIQRAKFSFKNMITKNHLHVQAFAKPLLNF